MTASKHLPQLALLLKPVVKGRAETSLQGHAVSLSLCLSKCQSDRI